MPSVEKDPGSWALDFTVMAVFLKWPISVACPSELDLGAVCWRLGPAVPEEFISGRNYQWQSLREEVVSLTDRQQHTVIRTMEGWSHFTAEERKKKDEMSHWTPTSHCTEQTDEASGVVNAACAFKNIHSFSKGPRRTCHGILCSCKYKIRFQTGSSWVITFLCVA